MGNSLSVCRDSVVELRSERYNGRVEAGENFFHLVVASTPVSVCNDNLSKVSTARVSRNNAGHQWLSFRVDTWSMKGMAGDDVNILGQVSLQGRYLRRFT